MRERKMLFTFILLLLCLCFVACGGGTADDTNDIVGNDWRVTGVVRDGGTITREGEDTSVLVCIGAEDAAFYYDSEEQVLFDSVEYPIALQGDPWEAFQSIDFADRNGDGNSDVAIVLDGGADGTLLMVWFWDSESGAFVFQPEASLLPADE